MIVRLHGLLYISRVHIPQCVLVITCPILRFFNSFNIIILTTNFFLFSFFHTRNLKRALQLANIVADSRYRLYEDFTNQDGRRLSDYLDKVRTAILGALEAGGSDPFRVLQQQQ
jgi:nuclear pore complex protein Nup107